MEIRHRFIESKVVDYQSVIPILFINGARQVGKSTLVRNLQIPDSTYFTFDRPTNMASAVAAPEAFLTSTDGTLIIDEVQMVPELFRPLKVIVDELRLKNANANGKYILTGSANILALPDLSDPLVGRMSILTLYPFAVAEYIQTKGNAIERLFNHDFENVKDHSVNLNDGVNFATFPEIAGRTVKEKNIWFDGYLSTILQRDVKMLADLEKISLLPGLLRVLASRVGGLINDSDISREVGLNSVTGKFYRNILKMMFLNFDIQPWFRNIGKRLVKSPKGYLIDTSLLCYLLGIDFATIQQKDSVLAGHVFENFIATELIKLLSFSDIKAQLLHFRTSDGKEVDFILERPDGSLFAIEIKLSESVGIYEFKNIQLFNELNPEKFAGGVVLYSGNQVVSFGKNLWAVPYYFLWQ